MGTSTIATQARPTPSSMRTQKGTITESGAWRLRSRSYSHDNELYRMGMRKTAQGEWAAVDNKVPIGLANAMRQMRIRSATRIKREPSVDVDMEGEDADAEETVVFEYEKIRVYIDVDREIEGGHVYVDEQGRTVETVMRSVEIKSEFVADAKMGDGVGEPGDTSASTSGDARPLDGRRDSPASIVEEDEDRMDVDPSVIEDQPEGARDWENAARQEARPIAKREKKWTDPEIHYVGALLDAGYKSTAIPDLFCQDLMVRQFRGLATREWCMDQLLKEKVNSEKMSAVFREEQQDTLLRQRLGPGSGKWKKMDQLLKEEADSKNWKEVLRQDLLVRQLHGLETREWCMDQLLKEKVDSEKSNAVLREEQQDMLLRQRLGLETLE